MARGEDEDVWGRAMYVASFGGLRLDIVSTDDSADQDLVRHKYPRRAGADVRDMGSAERTTRCEAIFFERKLDPDETGNHIERFQAFERLKREQGQDGRSRPFVHPLTGTYLGKIGAFSYRAASEPRDCIMVSFEVVEDSKPAALTTNPFTAAGVPQVEAAAEEVGRAAAALYDPDDEDDAAALAQVTAASSGAVATVTAWEQATEASRDVTTGMLSTANAIDQAVEELELAADIKAYGLYVGMVKLRSAMQKAAESFQARAPKVFPAVVPDNAPPLLNFAAQIFGADQAEARAKEIAKLNRIRNPARLEPGTTLKVLGAPPRGTR